jgi:hypothetical protein
VSLIPSLTEGLAGLGTTVCIKLLSRMNKPIGLWVGGPQRNEISVAARNSAPPASTCLGAATAQRTKARAADWSRRLLEQGPWPFSYRALGCGDGAAGVPVVVGVFSTVHVMALRSYLWPGAFFNASFVVFMTG